MAQRPLSAMVNQTPVVVRVEIAAHNCDGVQTRKGELPGRNLDHGRAHPGPSCRYLSGLHVSLTFQCGGVKPTTKVGTGFAEAHADRTGYDSRRKRVHDAVMNDDVLFYPRRWWKDDLRRGHSGEYFTNH
jgi:hypothetical protein